LTRVAADSNVLVAATQADHPRHAAAIAALESVLDGNDILVLPVHSLVETYSVLTRLPPPARLAPSIAMGSIRNFVAQGEVVSLSSVRVLELLDHGAATGITGGRIYDKLIGTTAVEAGAEVLLTFNARHFANLGLSLRVVEPAE
jgi:predicted nucleic acid-binding protein